MLNVNHYICFKSKSKIMKYVVAFLLLIVLISCNKEPEFKYHLGQEENMVINEHNTSVKADASNDEAYLELDLDSDGIEDVKFRSWEYSIINPDGQVWGIDMNIINSNVSIYEVPRSGIMYEALGSPSFDFVGTFPRQTQILTFSCVQGIGSYEVQKDANNPFTFSIHAPLSYATYAWENKYSELTLVHSGYNEEHYEFNITNDSLIGVNVTQSASCQGVPENAVFYMAFRKTVLAASYVGWIEAKVTEGNRITILRTAISEESEDY